MLRKCCISSQRAFLPGHHETAWRAKSEKVCPQAPHDHESSRIFTNLWVLVVVRCEGAVAVAAVVRGCNGVVRSMQARWLYDFPCTWPVTVPIRPCRRERERERERARERVREGERFRHFIQRLNVGQYRRLQRIFTPEFPLQ